uniref:FBA_2 domain-containing protein n=1 Tax=Panagrellus redivivus TaxID=6233 RepID=A0A7E4VWA6_PANRE
MSSDTVEIRYSTARWELNCVNLKKLCTRWARKLNVRGFEWLYASPRTGYSKIMLKTATWRSYASITPDSTIGLQS